MIIITDRRKNFDVVLKSEGGGGGRRGGGGGGGGDPETGGVDDPPPPPPPHAASKRLPATKAIAVAAPLIPVLRIYTRLHVSSFELCLIEPTQTGRQLQRQSSQDEPKLICLRQLEWLTQGAEGALGRVLFLGTA